MEANTPSVVLKGSVIEGGCVWENLGTTIKNGGEDILCRIAILQIWELDSGRTLMDGSHSFLVPVGFSTSFADI